MSSPDNKNVVRAPYEPPVLKRIVLASAPTKPQHKDPRDMTDQELAERQQQQFKAGGGSSPNVAGATVF